MRFLKRLWSLKTVVNSKCVFRGTIKGSSILKCKETVNSELYCAQLEMLNEKFLKILPALVNRRSVLFLHDNAKPHTSKMTHEKIKELQWEVLWHPPYSVNGAFPSQPKIQKFRWCRFGSVTTYRSKNPKFFSDGFDQLPTLWQKVIDCNGDYFVK